MDMTSIFKSAGQISDQEARELLKQGAWLIDVRTPEEFGARHLAGAINVPLDALEVSVSKVVNDMAKPLLLYCASGMRSRLALKILQDAGYANVFDLGSYGRAEGVLNSNTTGYI